MSDTILSTAAPHPMQAAMDRLHTPGEIAAFEAIRCIVQSLIRARVVDAQLADDFRDTATAAVEAGGSAFDVLALWLPLYEMAQTCMDPATWAARRAPSFPTLPEGGGEGLPARHPVFSASV